MLIVDGSRYRANTWVLGGVCRPGRAIGYPKDSDQSAGLSTNLVLDLATIAISGDNGARTRTGEQSRCCWR